MFKPHASLSSPPSTQSTSDKTDVEKLQHRLSDIPVDGIASTNTGIPLIVRKSTGLTKRLKNNVNLLTLTDGPYRDNESEAILKCDRVLLLGGGIGVTGLLSCPFSHPNVKFAWSLKESDSAVLEEIDHILSSIHDRKVKVGERLNVDALLQSEMTKG